MSDQRPPMEPVPTDSAGMAELFVELLEVEEIDRDIYRGMATPGGQGRVFGGQVIGQALRAAMRTVEPGRIAHSLHAYFIRAGDSEKPILYLVSRDRDGRSFNTRRVVAQQDGEVILNMSCSFQVEEGGLSHQSGMPDVPAPDALPTEAEMIETYRDSLPEGFLRVAEKRPLEIRMCDPRAPFDRSNTEPQSNFWFRTRGGLPDDESLHRAALAFASDMGLLAVAMMPHGKSFMDPDMQVASLDHAMWFHAPVKADDWLLYATDSPWAGGARGFARGQIFNQDGVMVAESVQEGLIRDRS